MTRILTFMMVAFLFAFGADKAEAQLAPPKTNAFGAGVALGGYNDFGLGLSAFYAIPFESDIVGIEINGTYGRGEVGSGSFATDYTTISAGIYGTARFPVGDQLSILGLGGIRFWSYFYDDFDNRYDSTAFFFDLGAAAEYQLTDVFAVRGQLVSTGALEILAVIGR